MILTNRVSPSLDDISFSDADHLTTVIHLPIDLHRLDTSEEHCECLDLE